MRRIKNVLMIPILLWIWACDYTSEDSAYLISFDDRVYEILGTDLEITVIADGLTWAEGPAWHDGSGKLYFSDVPENKLYSWSEESGKQLELNPSGSDVGIEGFREPGTNGILVIPDSGELLVANHGIRGLQLIDPVSKTRKTLTNGFRGKKFNSPNDIALSTAGSIYFTDPPYGLEGIDNSPLKELEFNGVYQLSPEGIVTLVDDSLTFPNGVHLSPDEEYLYVAVSDFRNPAIYRYKKQQNGTYSDRELWFDARSFLSESYNGTMDGLAVRSDGMVFASGPGGIIIIDPSGKELGIIAFDSPASNCTFGNNEKSLFVTVSNRVVHIKLP